MDPIPETTEAVDEYGPFVRKGDLLDSLRRQAAEVRELVPECVGLSVAALHEGITFTLVATDEEIAALDAIQYLSTGPCVRGVTENRVIAYDGTDENDWHLFARATAAAAIASTLTLPILDGESVVGSVNLYGATQDAFSGHHEELARIFDAWAPGAVTNADLGFTTRGSAEHAPTLLREQYQIEVAAGIIASREGTDLAAALEHLLDAARRAAVPVAALAALVIDVENERDSR